MTASSRSAVLQIPEEHHALRRMTEEGLPVDPAAWRRYLVETYSQLAGLHDARSAARRVNQRSYGLATYKAALAGNGVVLAEWDACRTGRIASQRPLLRCITKQGSIRRGVVAPAGTRLIDTDWRSSHLWIVAVLTGDAQLLADLEDGSAYEAAALILLGEAADRKIAKIAVLASLNGQGDAALAKTLGCTVPQATERRAELHERWPGLARWSDMAVRRWQAPLGRIVELPDEEDLYVSLGWRLQSIEADALELATRTIQAAGHRVVWAFYDQLLVVVPEAEADVVAAVVAAAMDAALRGVLELPKGKTEATTACAIKYTWGDEPGDGPPPPLADPGGELQLPAGPLGPDGPWSAREALQQVLDEPAKIADLHKSPWLPHFANHEDLLERLAPKATANRIRTAAKAASKEAQKQHVRDAAQAQQQRAESSTRKTAGAAAPDGGTGKLHILSNTEISETEAETIRALTRLPNLYARGRCLVHILRNDDGEPVICDMPVSTVSSRMDVAAKYLVPLSDNDKVTPACVEIDDRWFKPVQPPMRIAQQVKDAGAYPGVRQLTGVTRSPVLRPDGTLVLTPGHDSTTGLVYLPQGAVPQVPARPTRDDAVAALRRLANVTDEVPFAKPADAAAARALALTLAGRSAIDGCTPCFVATANQARVGKTFLLQIMGLIGLGDWVGTTEWPTSRDDTDAAELRKRIDADIMAGDPMVLWDNVRVPIAGTSLEAAITSTRWKLRVLSKSSTPTVPQMTVFSVALNGMQIAGDMVDRVLPIRLFYAAPSPATRVFKRPNLKGLVQQHRPALHAATLTVLSAYLQAGAPDMGLTPWNSFNEWSALVRGALVWAGDVDPFEARHGVEMADHSSALQDRLIAFIRAVVYSKEWSTRELADALERGHTHENVDIGGGWTAKDARELAVELDVWESTPRNVNRRKLGWRVSARIGQPASDGVRIARVMDGDAAKRCTVTRRPFYTLESSED